MLGCCQVLWEEMVTTSGRVVYVAEIYNVFCRLLQVVPFFSFWNLFLEHLNLNPANVHQIK